MTYEVKRNYLEITSIHDLNENKKIYKDFTIILLDPVDFELNKFFYKNIGKNYKWVDRLVWSETKWIDYVSNKNVKTFILKKKTI